MTNDTKTMIPITMQKKYEENQQNFLISLPKNKNFSNKDLIPIQNIKKSQFIIQDIPTQGRQNADLKIQSKKQPDEYTIGVEFRKLQFKKLYESYKQLPEKIIASSKEKFLKTIQKKQRQIAKKIKDFPNNIHDSVVNKVSYTITRIENDAQDAVKQAANDFIVKTKNKLLSKYRQTKRKQLQEARKNRQKKWLQQKREENRKFGNQEVENKKEWEFVQRKIDRIEKRRAKDFEDKEKANKKEWESIQDKIDKDEKEYAKDFEDKEKANKKEWEFVQRKIDRIEKRRAKDFEDKEKANKKEWESIQDKIDKDEKEYAKKIKDKNQQVVSKIEVNLHEKQRLENQEIQKEKQQRIQLFKDLIKNSENVIGQSFQNVDALVQNVHANAGEKSISSGPIFYGPVNNINNSQDSNYFNDKYPFYLTTLDENGGQIPYVSKKTYVSKYSRDGRGTRSVRQLSIGQIKQKMKEQRDTLNKSIELFIHNRKSRWYKKNKNNPHFSMSLLYYDDPFRFDIQKPRRIQPFTLWKNKEYEVKISDSLAYQAQSYMYDIFTKSSMDQWSKQNINGIQYQHKDGNIINFWIQDVNNGRIMTTPAFLSNVKDDGGKGNWDQNTYIGAQYPKFLYKNSEKRVIQFQLKLGCFDEKYLSQYIKKLNFLRGVGFPKYSQVIMGTQNYNRNITFAKAPIYKLTLGSIVSDQYGFFDECSFDWQDESSVWNLSDFKSTKYGLGLAMSNQYIQKSINAITSSIQIPIVTTIKCQFTCIYGRGPSNDTQFYGYQPFRDRYQQVSSIQPIPTEEEIVSTNTQISEQSGQQQYYNQQDYNPGAI